MKIRKMVVICSVVFWAFLPIFLDASSKVVLIWDGSGYNSQVGARGSVTMTREGNQVTLEGTLSINSRTPA